MHELILITASLMSFDEIIDRIDSDIEKYKANPGEETKHAISLGCMLFSAKQSVDMNKGDVIDTIKDFARSKKAFDLLKTSVG